MTVIWKAAAVVILTVIVSTAIGKTEKDIAVVLTATACCGVALLAMESLTEVVAFIWKISDFSEYQSSFTGILLKIAGVAVITEITAMISIDAGSSSLEKAMHFLGNTTILSMSIPLFESLIDIVQEILHIV